MNESLLTSLEKKDSDLKVISTDTFGAVIETELNVGYALEEEEEEEEEKYEPIELSVPARVVRHVFTINVAIAFFVVVFGLVPYFLLNPFYVISLTLTVSSAAFMVLGVPLVHYFREHDRFAIPLFLIWLFILFVFIFSISALLKSMAPFQACVIFFMQSCSALVYCLWVNRQIDPWWSAGIMMLSGILIWSLGLYSFIREQDWITSGVLFFICVLFNPLYSAWRIKERNYRLDDKELVKASIEFFTGWIFVKCVRRPPPPSFAPVVENPTVQSNVDSAVHT